MRSPAHLPSLFVPLICVPLFCDETVVCEERGLYRFRKIFSQTINETQEKDWTDRTSLRYSSLNVEGEPLVHRDICSAIRQKRIYEF